MIQQGLNPYVMAADGSTAENRINS